MRLWAFGVSPHGLGIPESRLWHLTMREYHALADVYKNQTIFRWAFQQSMYANAHRDPKTAPDAWLPEDFMPGSDRQARIAVAQKERLEAQLANAALMKMKPGQAVDGIPEWAIGPYQGSA